MKILTREEVRIIDSRSIKEFGISGLILMENAGRAVANVVLQHYPECQDIAIICGTGNNGGDGFVIARHLLSANRNVTTYLIGKRAKYMADAKTNLNSLEKSDGKVIELNEKTSAIKKADLYIDSIFGTGLDRNVEGFHKKAINFLNSQNKPVISVDIPSGLDSDSGRPLGAAVNADSTVTFIKPKRGMCIHPGVELTGKLFVADLTTPKILEDEIKTELLTFSDCGKLLKKRHQNSHKGTHGHLFILAGSTGKSGAAILSANAALRTGAGLLTLGVPKSINSVIEENCIEAMSIPLEETVEGTLDESSLKRIIQILKGKKSALAIGPGLSTNEKTKNLVLKIISKAELPVVLDADALNILSENENIIKKAKSDVVITPHPGEMARLAKLTNREVQENRIDVAKEFATKNRCTVILKGARSVIASPDGRIFINPTGNPGMATGGMGDALTGMVASFLAQGYSSLNSSILGTFLHGFAGDICANETGETGFTATDLILNIPAALTRIDSMQEPYFSITR